MVQFKTKKFERILSDHLYQIIDLMTL